MFYFTCDRSLNTVHKTGTGSLTLTQFVGTLEIHYINHADMIHEFSVELFSETVYLLETGQCLGRMSVKQTACL